MPANDAWNKMLPPNTQDLLQSVWDNVPSRDRKTLLGLMGTLPANINSMRTLVRLSTVQLRMAFGRKHRVAIVGPTNVGKSTLYNQFVHEKADHSVVSPLPGTTRANHTADAGLFSIVDTPGTDAVGPVGEFEHMEAFSAADQSDFIIIVFDAIQGIKQNELDLYQHLVALKKPYIVVLNKIDLVRRHEKDVLAQVAQHLGLETEQIVPISASLGHGLENILAAIAMTEPEMISALGRALPQYRWQLAQRSIVSAASASAVIALTPIPMIDFIPLLTIQSAMVLGVARIYKYDITLARAGELIATFGVGFLGRTLFYQLSKLGGIPGWMLSAAIASSTTVAMGYAAAVWFERGERLSGETLSHITERVTGELLHSLSRLGNRRPREKNLQEQINLELEKTSLDEILLSETTTVEVQIPTPAIIRTEDSTSDPSAPDILNER
jgi:GTPase